jgi:cation:H+ antiporter
MFLALFLLIIGLVVLILGAEGLVRGASSFAKKWGIAPLVIGLTIVSFGTSAPELIVNILSAVGGNSDIGIGNIIGSNISNIFLILGITAIIGTIKVHSSTVWKEIPFGLLAVLMLLFMGSDMFLDGATQNVLGRTDGLALMCLFVIFIYYTFGLRPKKNDQADSIKTYSGLISTAFLLGGMFGLFVGGKMLVDNAVILAKLAGLSENFIGLTIVAVGTSLPELATSVVAALRKQSDIAIGNIVGSNIFNILWVLGLTSTILPLPFSPATIEDILICVFATFVLFLAMFIGKKRRLQRWQGICFVAMYIGYIVYLVYRG